MARVFIGIGSSLDPERNVRAAIGLLRKEVHVRRVSTFYRTEALRRPGDPAFYNGVIEAETDIPPLELQQAVLRRIEEALGRRRTEDRYAPRTVDLDILVYGDVALKTEHLTLPNPNIEERAFVALPLHELAPDLVLPGSGQRLEEIAARCADHELQSLPEYTQLLRRDLAHGSSEG
jgi:dihydroneopterin aldolase/2-amino-4-hydroxy-6-hydroxymethyldihydropteridine diphosphokinase